MTRTQRLTMVGLAVAVAIVAFVVLQAGDDEETASSDNAAAPAATATPTPTGDQGASDEATPEATPRKRPRRPSIPTLTAGEVRELEVKQGDTVRFAARATEDDEIHVHGYDISKEAPAGKRVQMSFKADITGIFEIEFEHAGEPIAELKVEP